MDYIPAIQVPSEALDSSAVLVGGELLARFDQEAGHWVLNQTKKNVDYTKSTLKHEVRSVSLGERRLGSAGDEIHYLAGNNFLVSSSAMGNSQSIKSTFDKRPARVFVDAPARIERDTEDPFYRLANRAYQATPSIARTGDSRYWTAWRADNTHNAEGPGNFAVLAYSDDGGESVKEYGYLTYSPSNPGNQIVDPMLWTDPKGRLWLFYGVLGNNKLFDGVGGAWAVVSDNPNSQSPEWGKPFRLSYYSDPRRPVKVGDKWYIALDGWRFSAEYPPAYMDHVGPHIYELDWENQKIRHVSQLPPNNNGQYSGFFETEFVERSDGSVLALLRSMSSKAQMLYSVSRDSMKSWTPWQNYTVTTPSSSSRSWLGRTPSGLLLLCWNNDLVRGALTIGLSDDDGDTYRYKKVIEPDSSLQVSYPVVSFGDDGEIIVIYDNGRDSHKQIRISKINEHEIISGEGTPSVKVVSDPTRR